MDVLQRGVPPLALHVPNKTTESARADCEVFMNPKGLGIESHLRIPNRHPLGPAIGILKVASHPCDRGFDDLGWELYGPAIHVHIAACLAKIL
jgi:hypothetical protein